MITPLKYFKHQDLSELSGISRNNSHNLGNSMTPNIIK